MIHTTSAINYLREQSTWLNTGVSRITKTRGTVMEVKIKKGRWYSITEHVSKLIIIVEYTWQ